MITARNATHAILHRDPDHYCAHPQIVVANSGEWLVVFNKAPRRPVILHPPQDPEYRNVIIRSSDYGSSWTTPEPVPDSTWGGVECAGLTALSDGRLMLNQWRYHWYPLADSDATDELHIRTPTELAHDLLLSGELGTDRTVLNDPEALLPWARGGGEAWVHLSSDDGRTWSESERLDVLPFSGGYGMRGALQLPDGTILLPLSDAPRYSSIFLVRSNDGRSWGPPTAVASRDGKEFEEPSLIRRPTGRLVMLMRENVTKFLHQCISDDDGHQWTDPVLVPIKGYPPHLAQLSDDRILCTVGWRYPDFGIRAIISCDGAETWETSQPIVIRTGLRNKDLGYPCTLANSDASLFTVYYAQDEDGLTCIWGTRWMLQ